MKSRIPVWKLAAATTSLALVGASIAYRAGAFTADGSPAPAPTSAGSPSPASTLPTAASPSVRPDVTDLDALRPKLDTSPLAPPRPGKAAAGPAAMEPDPAPPEEFFGGSKSGPGLPRPTPTPPPPPAQTADPKHPAPDR
jgi:hypothetical protein